MSANITLEPTDDVPTESRVCHYDELGEDAKERLPDIADGDVDTGVDASVADEFEDCDLVKYIDYYEVSVDRPAT